MSEPRNKRLISADTVYGLMQSANDLMRERFTSNGRTLDDNSWRTCPVLDLQSGFWQAIRDRDFGSVLTYTAMLAGRDVNVADLIHDSLESYNEQIVKLQTDHSGYVKKLNDEQAKKIEEKDKTIDDAVRAMETMQDTIRLMGITEGQHKQTISDLRTKLGEHGTPEPYFTGMVGVTALESERTPELCYSVETVCGELVETLVIQGDPEAVKDLVQMVRAEKDDYAISGCTSIDIASLKSSSQTVPENLAKYLDGPTAVVSKAGDVAKDLYGQDPAWSRPGVAPAERHKDPKVELAMAWHSGDFHRVMRAFETLYVAGKDPVAFVKRMKNVAVPPDND